MSTELREGLYGLEFRSEDLRRVAREDKKTYDIKQLWNVHHEILNLRAQGYKENDIASILNITPQTVSNICNSTLGEEKLSIIRKERDEDAKITVEKIRVLKDKAIKVYHEIFDQKDDQGNPLNVSIKDRLHCADVVMLELSGYKVPTRIQQTTTSMTAAELLEFKQRGLQTAKDSGLIVDVTPKEISGDNNLVQEESKEEKEIL
jgi:predicted transcriptional regulator